MTPSFWLIIDLQDGSMLVENFNDKDTLNDFLTTFPNATEIRSLEVVSGFSIVKRSRDGQ